MLSNALAAAKTSGISAITGCVPARLSRRMALCWPAWVSSQTFHSGWKWSVALFSIHEAKDSFSQRSSHQPMVTRLPNHWWATSWATVMKTFCLSASVDSLGSSRSA